MNTKGYISLWQTYKLREDTNQTDCPVKYAQKQSDVVLPPRNLERQLSIKVKLRIWGVLAYLMFEVMAIIFALISD